MARTATAAPALTSDQEETAELLVAGSCRMCHSAEMLEQQRLTPAQWEAAVKKMSGWGAPLEPEHGALVVRYLSGRWSPRAPPYVPAKIDAAAATRAIARLPDGALGGGNAKAGAAVYALRCLPCHAADGHGSGTGTSLVERPILGHAAELAELLRTGRGRMPAAAEITDREIKDLLAHLRTFKD